MKSKQELCRNWKLYVITDLGRRVPGLPLAQVVADAVLGGASVIQLRDKESSDRVLIAEVEALLMVTRSAGIPLIVNDRVDVARRSGADGVHLGQEDDSLAEARQALGQGAIIGRSTHNEGEAILAEKEGFDYIAVGPIFETPTKPKSPSVGLKLVRFASRHIRIPFVAIGGIDESNIRQVVRAGAKTVAVVRAVMQAKDPRLATRQLIRKMNLAVAE